MTQPIEHPLPLKTHVTANKKSCACRGAKILTIEGTILKIIKNHQGHWYYLSSGHTVKDSSIVAIKPV